jgi:hypothetical protein
MFAAIALVMMTPLPDLGRDPPLPPLADLRRFPDAKATEARFRALVTEEQEWQHFGEKDRRRQIKYAKRCWGMLREALDSSGGERRRRACLQTLNQLLGDENYQRGQMP